MSRVATNPTNAAPWLATWDAADNDISSVNEDQAPVALNIPPDSDFLRLIVASDSNNDSPVWHLILAEQTVHPDSSSLEDPWVKAYISWTTQSVASSRRGHGDGANGTFLHNPINAPAVLDLRGMWSKSDNQKWFLAVQSLGGAGTLYLHAYTAFTRRPS